MLCVTTSISGLTQHSRSPAKSSPVRRAKERATPTAPACDDSDQRRNEEEQDASADTAAAAAASFIIGQYDVAASLYKKALSLAAKRKAKQGIISNLVAALANW